MLTPLRQRNFALLWLGGLISQTGDWLLQIGLPVYVYLLTGSALATGIMLMVSFVPTILLGSVAGVFVDRWDRLRTMLVANVLLAAGLLPLFLVHDKGSLWMMYLTLFFEAAVAQFVLPAESALIPHLVSEEQLVPANSLKSISMSVSRLVGAALGGLLLSLLGLHSTVLLDLLSFLFVAAMLWLIKLPAKAEARPESSANELSASTPPPSLLAAWRQLGHEWLEGMQLIYRQPLLVVLFVMVMAQSLGEGVFGVMLVVFVRRILNSGSIVYGTLLSVQAVGSLLGGLVIGKVGKRFALARLIGACTCLFGLIDLLIIDLPLFVGGSVLLIGLLFLLVGIPGVGAGVGMQTLFQTIVEDRLRGRIFGAFLAVESLVMLLGMALAGALGDRLGPVLLLNIQGSVYFLSGIFALLVLGRMLARRSAGNQQKSTQAASAEKNTF
jgi:MFS family permease